MAMLIVNHKSMRMVPAGVTPDIASQVRMAGFKFFVSVRELDGVFSWPQTRRENHRNTGHHTQCDEAGCQTELGTKPTRQGIGDQPASM